MAALRQELEQEAANAQEEANKEQYAKFETKVEKLQEALRKEHQN